MFDENDKDDLGTGVGRGEARAVASSVTEQERDQKRIERKNDTLSTQRHQEGEFKGVDVDSIKAVVCYLTHLLRAFPQLISTAFQI